DMVLNHVSEHPGGVIVTAASFDSNCFGVCDLNVIHVAAIPNRLEDAVRESEHHQVLHGLFAEVVINTVNLLFVEDPGYFDVQFFGAREVVPEGLLDDDASPTLSF